MKNIKGILIIVISIFITFFFACNLNINQPSWTFAFYLAGDNSLQREQINNLEEIIKGCKGLKNTKIVIFIDTGNAKNRFSPVRDTMILEPDDNVFDTVKNRIIPDIPVSIGKMRFLDFIQPKLNKKDLKFLLKYYKEHAGRFILSNDITNTEKQKLKSILIRNGYLLSFNGKNNLKASSSDIIRRFFSFVRDNYISDYYAYFISGHGNGWFPAETTGPAFNNPALQSDGSSFTDGNKTRQKNTSSEYYDSFDPFLLKEALKQNEPDILSLDMCLMSDMETIYQLRNSTKYLIACQNIIPSLGQNYDLLLRNIKNNNIDNPEHLAKIVLKTYREYYKNRQYTMSVTAIKYTPAFNEFVKKLNLSFSVNRTSHNITSPGNNTITHLPRSYAKSMADLYTVLNSLKDHFLFAEFNKTKKSFICDSFSTDKRFNGISIFFPDDGNIYNKFKESYHRLDFALDFPEGCVKYWDSTF